MFDHHELLLQAFHLQMDKLVGTTQNDRYYITRSLKSVGDRTETSVSPVVLLTVFNMVLSVTIARVVATAHKNIVQLVRNLYFICIDSHDLSRDG